MSRRIGLGLLLAATACGGSSAAPLPAVPQAALPSPSAVGSPVPSDLSAGGYGGPPVVTSPTAAAPRRSAVAVAVPKPAASLSPAASPSPSARPSPTPSPRPSPTPSPRPSPRPAPSPSPSATSTTHEIAMRGLTFAPSSLTIAVGDSVRVRNADTGHHTFTDGGVFDSGDLGPGQTFTYRFRAAGRFDFVCSYHSGAGMTGTVTVR